MKIHDLITTTDALADLCDRLGKGDFVCVDTEFMRENTYWPELCLVQIGNEEEAAAIDQQMVDVYEENGVEVVSMSEDDYNAWLEIARETSYKNFADNVPNGQAIIDAALAVE